MALDTNVFSKLHTFQDYAKLEDEFQLRKALQAAQIQESQAKAQSALQPDIEKLGQQAYLKAAQGIALSPQEAASLQYLDAKSQTVTFNPVTGAREEKPSLLQRSGMQFEGQPVPQAAPTTQAMPKPVQPSGGYPTITDVFSDSGNSEPTDNEWAQEYQKTRASLAGNPKAQAALDLQFAKDKISPTEGQSNAALYADRMAEAEPVITSTTDASKDLTQRFLGGIPIVGNYLTSADYQSAQQAQRDFINAVLRRESGAVISASEFDNASKQYFPQPGDSEQVIIQKAKNRETALKKMQRAAGASYNPPKPQDSEPQPVNLYKKSEADFNASKVASPAEIEEYKRMKGIK